MDMYRWVKSNWWKLSIILIILMMLLLFLVPMIIEKLFLAEAFHKSFVVNYDSNTIIGLYGDILVLIGTASLGALSLIQNHIAQEKTDEVNRLTLELQRRSMEIAEKRYSEMEVTSHSKLNPKFEIKNQNYSGFHEKLGADFTNVSGLYISNIKSLSFKVKDSDGKVLIQSNNVKLSKNSVKSGEKCSLNFGNDELVIVNGREREPMNNVILEWEFQCEDEYDMTHYFRCSLSLEKSNNMNTEPWDVIKVG